MNKIIKKLKKKEIRVEFFVESQKNDYI